MSICFLFAFEITIFIVLYKTSRYDLVSPANISLLTFIVATFFAIIGINTWETQFSIAATFYLIIGLTCMLFGQHFARITTKVRMENDYIDSNFKLERINISTAKVLFLDVIVITLTLLYVIDVLRAGVRLGASGLSSISAVYYAEDSGTSSIIRQGIKIVMAVGFVDSFIITRNLSIRWVKKDWLHIVSIICACICSFFTGVRTEVLRMVFAIFVLYYFNQKEKKGWKKDISPLLVRRFLPILVILAIAFTSMKTIIKSSDLPINEAFTTFEYIVYYIGSPILVFGIKEDVGFATYKRDLFGEITFNAFWENLADMGIISDKYLSIASTNVYISRADRVTANVDTIFGGLMIDFGLFGMSIFILLLYFVISKYYYKHVKCKLMKSNIFAYISYAFIFYLPAMAYYANVFGQYIATYFILTYIIMYFVYLFYFKVTITRQFVLKITVTTHEKCHGPRKVRI